MDYRILEMNMRDSRVVDKNIQLTLFPEQHMRYVGETRREKDDRQEHTTRTLVQTYGLQEDPIDRAAGKWPVCPSRSLTQRLPRSPFGHCAQRDKPSRCAPGVAEVR